ncbi:MAG: low molecular weight phosphatase family protein [Pseudomonadota bacterium]
MRGPNGEDLPGAVLFACNFNAVRSPMAAAIMKHLYGQFVYVDSAGVRAGELDPFVVAVMEEIGIDVGGHRPRSFDQVEEGSFDLVISLTPEAQHKAVELTRTMAVDIEYWPTIDPTAVHGSREQRLEAYRATRDGLFKRLKQRFAAE